MSVAAPAQPGGLRKIDGFPIGRRLVLFGAAALTACHGATTPIADAFASSPWRKLTLSDWKARLPPAAFAVLRQEDTEAPGSSPLNNEHRRGTFACIGCGLPIFKSDWKFDSGTGWPSFYTALPGSIAKRTDLTIGVPRTEYHCAECLGHQGHVFNDGPAPTGLRHCNNGAALKFLAAA